LVGSLSSLCGRCNSCKEAAEGLQPIIHFVGYHERLVRSVNKVFFVPKIDIVGFVERDRIPAFRTRPPTVKPPLPLPVLTEFNALPGPTGEEAGAPSKGRTRTRTPAIEADKEDRDDDGK